MGVLCFASLLQPAFHNNHAKKIHKIQKFQKQKVKYSLEKICSWVLQDSLAGGVSGRRHGKLEAVRSEMRQIAVSFWESDPRISFSLFTV